MSGTLSCPTSLILGGDKMKLLTKEIEKKLKKNPFGTKDGQGENAEVIVKYFNPCGRGTWLIIEGEKQENGDWMLYGLCHLYEWEWGYVLLSELEQIELPFQLKIERDLYSSGTVGEMKH